jgi:ribosome biogenesis ATPase
LFFAFFSSRARRRRALHNNEQTQNKKESRKEGARRSTIPTTGIDIAPLPPKKIATSSDRVGVLHPRIVAAMPSRNGGGAHTPPGGSTSSSLKTKKQLQQQEKRRKLFPAAAAAGLTLDPLLVPRLQAYAEGNKALLRDVDGAVEHLCRSFREYKRKPKGVFRKTVERAIGVVNAHEERSNNNNNNNKSNKRKNVREEGDDDDEDEDEDDDDDDDDDDDENDWSEEEDDDYEEDREGDLDVMNRALQSTYATASKGKEAPHQGGSNKQGVSGIEKGSTPSAFASEEKVKAAAMRALAKAEINPMEGRLAQNGTNIQTEADEDEEGEPTLAEKAQIAGHERAVHAVMRANQRNINKNGDMNNSVRGTKVKDRQLRLTSSGSKKGDKKRSKRKRRREAEEDQAIADLKKRMKADTNYDFHGDGDRENNSENLFSQATKPRNVSLSDLGGVEEALSAIDELILRPLKHPELYDWLGVPPPRGVLLHGPPGCGKTTVAHAVANAAIENNTNSVTFFSIAATEIVSGVSGDSEKKIRQLFRAAKAAAPSIVFIDEIDAICPKRESAQREMERRIVAQFLASIDDLNANDDDDDDDDDEEEEEEEEEEKDEEEEDGTDGEGKNVENKSVKEMNDNANNQIDLVEMKEATKNVEEPKKQEIKIVSQKKEIQKRLRRKRHVVVIGATNRADSLDAALRRSGRFDREIALGVPDEQARVKILKCHLKNLRLSEDVDETDIAKKTPGYVGADLAALVNEAATLAVSRVFENAKTNGCDTILTEQRLKDSEPLTMNELESVSVTNSDFVNALLVIQPSAKREGFTTTPSVTWSDVGALTDVREELKFSIVEPINRPHVFQYLGQKISTGCLLYGPPGCGKTLVAQAVANEANANFISIKGPELLNKYVGESERAVRSLFARARAAAPCVLFFDELDSLAPRRSGGGEGGSDAAVRVVNQLLTEMDGMESRKATFVIAATNRPDMIDPAMLRPGRLDKLLYVPLPDKSAREDILKALIRKIPIFSSKVSDKSDSDAAKKLIKDVSEFKKLDGFSGADLASLVREACVCAIRENLKVSPESKEESLPHLCLSHFEMAIEKVYPSVSAKDREGYLKLRDSLRGVAGALRTPKEELSPNVEKEGE